MVSALTPRWVSPPLSPLNAKHGGEYGSPGTWSALWGQGCTPAAAATSPPPVAPVPAWPASPPAAVAPAPWAPPAAPAAAPPAVLVWPDWLALPFETPPVPTSWVLVGTNTDMA